MSASLLAAISGARINRGTPSYALGAAYPIIGVQNQSPDNLKESGLYLYQNSFNEEEIGQNLAGFLFVFKNKTISTAVPWVLQIYLPVGVGYKNVWFRFSVDNGNTWRDWRKLLAE